MSSKIKSIHKRLDRIQEQLDHVTCQVMMFQEDHYDCYGQPIMPPPIKARYDSLQENYISALNQYIDVLKMCNDGKSHMLDLKAKIHPN